MKKIILIVFSILLLSGCGKITKENVIKEFSNKLSKSSSYNYNGTMQIISNEEKFDYKIDVSYLKDNYYKVKLVNQNNNHEQIILRNEDGVYVVTPSLNKSFKFQSEWPDNSSQAYILKSLLKDMKNDKDIKYEKKEDNYIIKTSVNYPNNTNLQYEKIYFDKDVSPSKVEVYNSDDTVAISVKFNKINYKANLKEKDFDLDNFIESDCCSDQEECSNQCSTKNDEKPTTSLEEAIYPLYVPANSTLSSNETIKTEQGDRLILTFSGDANFILVEETSNVSDEMEIIPVYGDPYLLTSSVVALGANSLYWSDNNVDFYLASNDLSGEEMLTIASSMANNQIVSQTK